MGKISLRLRFIILAVLVLASAVFLEGSQSTDIPFVAYLLIASAWTFLIVMLARWEAVRNGALLCSAVLFSLAVTEIAAYYATRSQIILTKTPPTSWRRNVTGIGYMPIPNMATEFKETLNGRLITHVTYTIDSNGL